jgi:alanine racemase
MGPAAADVPHGASGVLVTSLRALRRNYRALQAMAQPAETAAVIKADAYGLGALQVMPALEDEGCRTFFVATFSEAEAARRISSKATIFVLDGLLPGTADAFHKLDLRPVLGSMPELRESAAFNQNQSTKLPAGLHIDTGITRLGLTPADVKELAANHPTLLASSSPCLIMSHLACADEPGHPKNEAQRALFSELAASFPGVPKSLANSAGIFLGKPFHFDLVRPGIALYGGRPLSTAANPMEPVAWLYGRVAQVRWAQRGETVGYGAAQTLKRRTRIATSSVGYADGFFRALSASDLRDGPPAYVGKHRLPMLGRVSMDLITFDATEVPEGLVQRGGFVELLGERVTVDDLAAFADTIGYEVLARLGHRYHRIYADD